MSRTDVATFDVGRAAAADRSLDNAPLSGWPIGCRAITGVAPLSWGSDITARESRRFIDDEKRSDRFYPVWHS